MAKELNFYYKDRGIVETIIVEPPVSISTKKIGNITYHDIVDADGETFFVKIGPDSYPRGS